MKEFWKRFFIVAGCVMVLSLLIIGVLFFNNIYSCNNSYSEESFMSDAPPGVSESSFMRMVGEKSKIGSDIAIGYVNDKSSEDNLIFVGDKKIIRTGRINYRVTDIDNLYANIKGIIDRPNIFIQSSSTYKYDNSTNIEMEIKVVSGDFENVYGELKSLGGVVFENSSTQDVTEEFIDLSARLKVYEAQEDRLIAMFDKAEGVDELIRVENELARLRSQIESLQGRLKYLQVVTSYSTIDISISQIGAAFSSEGSIKLSDKLYFAYREGINAFKSVVVFIAKFILWTWMYWGILFVVAYIAKKKKRVRGRR